MNGNKDALSAILKRLNLTAGIFTEASFCGAWAVDTSGQRMATFHLIQRGECWLQADEGSARRLSAGDFVLFPRDAQHLITSTPVLPAGVAVNETPQADATEPSTDMLCGYFEFGSRAIWPLLDGLPDVLVLDLAHIAASDSRALLKLIIAEAERDRPGREAVLDFLSHVLFVHTIRDYISSGPSSGLLAALAEPRIGRALNRFHSAPEQHWSVERLGREAGMGRASFASSFRELIGDTPMSYVTNWRMQMALDLLTTTEQSVGQIADAVGYQSETAFRSAFRQRVGQPPGAYRRVEH